MLRREFNLGLCLLALARCPLFWLATRCKARVFLVGFAEGNAKDESWFTPAIRSAFQSSSALWLELAPAEAAANQDAAAKAKADAEYERLSHEPSGRTFFDELEPRVRERTLSYMAELGVKRESVEKLRPWWTYYTINSAFWSRTKPPYEAVNLDVVSWKLAKKQGKTIHYEMPDGLAFARFMAAMPEGPRASTSTGFSIFSMTTRTAPIKYYLAGKSEIHRTTTEISTACGVRCPTSTGQCRFRETRGGRAK